MKNKLFLTIPISFLYNVESIEEMILDLRMSNSLKDGYNLDERLNIYDALLWAEQNPNYQFKDIMKDSPVIGQLNFENQEIHNYLISFKTFMENEDYGLLTDNRPTKEF